MFPDVIANVIDKHDVPARVLVALYHRRIPALSLFVFFLGASTFRSL